MLFIFLIVVVLADDNLNLKVDSVGTNFINMSWNEQEYLKRNVRQIRLVAEPSGVSIPIAEALVNSSLSNGSIITNLRPSTRYKVYVEELSNPRRTRILHYVTTGKGGK